MHVKLKKKNRQKFQIFRNFSKFINFSNNLYLRHIFSKKNTLFNMKMFRNFRTVLSAGCNKILKYSNK